ncbi:DUF4097 family beta strand repeat-containing protein [Bacillus sp. OTU530]|uniref:DUF4097 family beta strand repeat-containing protein n=1 Tax=Bacillus sp. OTU530 TaxID=3043862 RepID=UPI00313B0B59
MSNIKKLSLLALAFLLVGVIGAFITFGSLEKQSSISEEKVIDNPNITAVQVEAGNAAIEILPTTDAAATVSLSGTGNDHMKQRFSAEVEGTTLAVKLESQKLKLFNFDFRFKPLTVKVLLPEKVYESLQIDSNNGRVKVEKVNANNVKAELNNGMITLKHIGANAVDVESDNGKIQLEYVEGTIKGKTSNGRIFVVTKDLERMMQLGSNNGSIEIQTEKDPVDVAFDVHVDNGHIDILDKYEGNAVIGKGTHVIKLTTNNGRITVTK